MKGPLSREQLAAGRSAFAALDDKVVQRAVVEVQEIETYSDAQLAAIFQAAPAGWARLAIQIL